MEFAHHCARNRKTARNIFELSEGRFLRCTHINKKGNEKKKGISKKADETENKCAALADTGGDLRGPRITQSRGEKRAQDTPPSIGNAGSKLNRTRTTLIT